MIETAASILSNPWVADLAFAVAGLVGINVLVRLLHRRVSARVSEPAAKIGVRRTLSLAGYLASLLLLAAIFSDQLSNLAVAMGVAGAGIAFALQEVIVSFAGWIALSFGQFYRVGDRVQLGGIKGDVIDIGVLRTTIMEIGEWIRGDQYNGRIVRIANSFVFKEPVYNYSGDFPFVWDEITVPIRHGSDHRLARAILIEAANQSAGEFVPEARSRWEKLLRKYALEAARIEPSVALIVNDNWIEFTVRYVVDFKKRRGTKDGLFTAILDAIERSEGKVSLASSTLQLVETPTLSVRLEPGA